MRGNSMSIKEKMDMMAKGDVTDNSVKLGTFKGVFVPTLQNILGIILFVRLPRIAGEAGIGQALAIVLLGCLASCLTSLSMSAVATNGVPKGGGCFSIIKDSLGPEFGGTVGILLFLANCFGVAMYVLASVEILQGWMPGAFGEFQEDPDQDDLNKVRLIGIIILGGLFTIVIIGISYISKTALLLLTGVSLSILSIYAGVISHTINPTPSNGLIGITGRNFVKNLVSDYPAKSDFAFCLSVFFPAVTDPLAGSNLSGDLKDPQKSIPPGTLFAVFCTTLVFSGQVIFCGASVTREALINDAGGQVVTSLAWPVKELVYCGMLMSTWGAGLQSLAGAPRLLAAISKNNLIPELKFIEPPPGQEPRRAVILCASVSLCCIMIGQLDGVAPFITMWFLTCYCTINGACAYLAYEQSPNFRPRWKYFDWRLSLLGAAQCASMMFFISWYFAFGAFVLAFCIYKYIEYQLNKLESSEDSGEEIKADWRAPRRFQQARAGLLALREGDMDFKYWRPFILFLCKTSQEDGTYVAQAGMINLISQFMKRGKGLSIVAGVVEGDFADKVDFIEQARRHLDAKLVEKNIEGFSEMVCARTELDGHKFLLHAKGLGYLRPNTVMIGWPADIGALSTEAKAQYCDLVKDVNTAKKTLLICKGAVEFPDKDPLTTFIDVWWIFDLFPANGLLLLMPYLLQQHSVWKKTRTRLFVVAQPDTDYVSLKTLLAGMIASGGMVAEVEVLHVTKEDAPRFASAEGVMKAADDHDLKAGLTMNRFVSMEVAKHSSEPDIGFEGLEDGGPANMSKARSISPSTSILDEIQKDSKGSKMTGLLEKISGNSDLCVMTLPKKPEDQAPGAWLESVNELTASLKRVIFVQETGEEKIQFYSD